MSNKAEQAAVYVQLSQDVDTKKAKQSKAAEKAEKKQQKKQRKAEKKKNKIPRKRIFPIPLRIITVLLLAGLALISGLMIGYGVLGGLDPKEVLELDTWKHIADLVMKEE